MAGVDDASTPWPASLPKHINLASGKLIVTIVGCNDVLMADKSGTSDPYCLLGVGTEAEISGLQVPKAATKPSTAATNVQTHWLRTETVKECLSPVFGTRYDLPLARIARQDHLAAEARVLKPESFMLKLLLFDWDRIGSNDFLGEVTLGLFRPGVMNWTPGAETTLVRGFVDLRSKVPIGLVYLPRP
jgi:hypothetical protein